MKTKVVRTDPSTTTVFGCALSNNAGRDEKGWG